MFSPWLLSALGIGYMSLLFALAAWADRHANNRLLQRASGVIFSLAVAVYISSWAYYGMVGNAQDFGWLYLSTNLGPVLFFLFATPVLIRLFRYRQKHNITSIADYIAFRFGRDNRLAVAVTVICLFIVVPYLALQIKSTAAAFSFLITANSSSQYAFLQPAALAMTAVLTVFAMLFGTRILDSHERNAGLITAIAFASLAKLVAFGAVGMFALLWLRGLGDSELAQAGSSLNLDNFHSSVGAPLFWVNLLLGLTAIVCLPRQFHVQTVECRSEQDLLTARWLLPAFVLLFVLLAIPIAVAGRHYLQQQKLPADLFMLALPLQQDHTLLTLISFMGGVSAAASMFVLSMIALTIMFSNHIIMPVLLRRQQWLRRQQLNFDLQVLLVRRLSMLVIAILAYLFYLLIDRYATLSSLGYLSLSLSLQLGPAMLYSLRRASLHRLAVHAGLLAGSLSWVVLLLLPGTLGVEPLFSRQPPAAMPPGNLIAAITAIDISWRTLLTLLLNLLALHVTQWVCSALADGRLQIRRLSLEQLTRAQSDGMITVGAMYQLTASLCGNQRVRHSFAGHFGRDPELVKDQVASADLIRHCERLLAASVGQVSAREIISRQLTKRRTGESLTVDNLAIHSTYEAIRFNRQMLETILENIDTGISILDRDQCLIGWNQRYLDLMNFPRGLPYQGQPVIELMRIQAQRGYFGDDAAEEQMQIIMDMFRSMQPIYRVRDWHDSKRLIEVIGKPLHDHGYMLTYTDITDFRQREQELRQYTDNIPGAICYTDSEEIIRFVNKAFVRLIGRSREAMLGQPIRNFMEADEYQQQSEQRQRANSGERVQFEITLNVGQTPKMYHVEFIPFIDASGRNNGFYSVSQDITSFRRIEQELRQRERDVREYTDRSPVMLLYIDSDLNIRFANRAFVNTMGFLSPEFIGKNIEEVLPSHMVDYNHQRRVAVLGGEIQRFEASFTDEFGQTRYLDVGYYPDRENGNQSHVRGYYTVAQDITERKLAELALEQANLNLERRVQERTTELHNLNLKLMHAKQQAQQANASKTRFLAAASHDLLQPMNAARLFISVINESKSDLSASHQSLIEQIDHSLENSEQLLEKLLEISKLDAGYQRTDIRVFNIHETMLPLAQSFQTLCEQKGIAMRLHCNKALCTSSDPQLLYRMVQNLLANAVRYTDQGGVMICSRLLRDSKKIRIAVYDTGSGIPASEQQAIFREFHQLHKNPDSNTGLGLGLTIVERLGQLLGHQVGVRSEPGRGSCFWIDLPIADASDGDITTSGIESTGQQPAERGNRFLEGTRILCIDDDADNRSGMRSLLSQWGADVRECASSEQAHEIICQEPGIDIVLSDYQLLEETSMDMLASLQVMSAKKLHIVIISAEQMPDIEAAIAAQGYTLLRKPLRPAKLRKLLSTLIGRN